MPFHDGAIVRLLTIQRNLGAISAQSRRNLGALSNKQFPSVSLDGDYCTMGGDSPQS